MASAADRFRTPDLSLRQRTDPYQAAQARQVAGRHGQDHRLGPAPKFVHCHPAHETHRFGLPPKP